MYCCCYISCDYLNSIKFRAALIFVQLSNPYICSRIIVARCQKFYFRVGLSYDWKWSARHYVKYAEIRAFCDTYFPVNGQNCIRIFPYLNRIGYSVQMRIQFRPNTGKYWSEKACILAYFTQWENRSWILTNNTGM